MIIQLTKDIANPVRPNRMWRKDTRMEVTAEYGKSLIDQGVAVQVSRLKATYAPHVPEDLAVGEKRTFTQKNPPAAKKAKVNLTKEKNDGDTD